MIDNYLITEPQNPFEVEKKSVQLKLRELFRERYPDLDITVVFDGGQSPEQLAALIQEQDISYAFSCIGMCKQEQRLIEIWAHLPNSLPVVGLGVGSSFDYLLGLQKRAPIFVQKLGLEWLYRLALSPRARWHRIVDAFYRFPRMIQDTPK
jgi:N-acetylglucosaminyldiphosphoundecaprenol N-acetyl-beta-D-mannosaminyltransferase